MSIYRTFKRPPLSDVHHVAEHVVGPAARNEPAAPASPGRDWTGLRRARPAETLLPMTERWMTTLPFKPVALSQTFPRIANTLTALWARPAALRAYMDELLVDRRGGRRGFSVEVLGELQALRAHYATVHPDPMDPWNERGSA